MQALQASRVLHLCAGNLYGGVERIVFECAASRALQPDMTADFAVCFEGRLSRELDETGAACERLGDVRFSRPLTVWRARHRLAALLAVTRPDVVLCHSSWICALAAPTVRSAGSRLALWVHDRLTGRPWTERWARRANPEIVISNSEFTDKSVAVVFPGTPRTVVYAPVRAGGAVDLTARAALRAELGATDDTVVIVIASRMDPMKGHRELLAATSDIPGDWQIWIAGAAQRPAEEAHARSLAASAESSGVAARVRFLGERADVPALLRAADIHCQPNSAPDAFGIAFIEALYASLAVVTTDLGGATEIVTERCGVLTPAGDGRALRSAL
ncbi:MAG: glycosyltransferase, partial [Acidobacteria bacterium]|nr:glycosyltransferase [Acidobacteriota bacterium]